MTTQRFCLDRDLLAYEPDLFGLLHLPSQVKAAAATGALSGTTFSDETADLFVVGAVAQGDVIHLTSPGGELAGPYEVVTVTSESALEISVLRVETADDPIAPPAAAGAIVWRIAMFAPQVATVSFALCERFRLSPGDPSSALTSADLLTAEPLRRACALGTLAAVYALWAGRAAGATWRLKAADYERLYGLACDRCHLAVDADGDGVAEELRHAGSFRLRRT